jgi:hypothetical protein
MCFSSMTRLFLWGGFDHGSLLVSVYTSRVQENNDSVAQANKAFDGVEVALFASHDQLLISRIAEVVEFGRDMSDSLS